MQRFILIPSNIGVVRTVPYVRGHEWTITNGQSRIMDNHEWTIQWLSQHWVQYTYGTVLTTPILLGIRMKRCIGYNQFHRSESPLVCPMFYASLDCPFSWLVLRLFLTFIYDQLSLFLSHNQVNTLSKTSCVAVQNYAQGSGIPRCIWRVGSSCFL
jgi:hypothetical protein